MFVDRAIRPSEIAPPAIAVTPAALLRAMLLVLGADALLLVRFLRDDASVVGAVAVGLGLLVALYAGFGRVAGPTVPLRRLALCGGLALAILALGGEGRLFYANLDWQVRDAALGDMIRAPWPFAYTGRGAAELLRAPIGMYLLPALAGKLGGQAVADVALLLQNATLLAILFALGSTLFATPRTRRIAGIVVIAFSGMDTLGVLIVNTPALWPLDRHINDWATIQYSAMLTQAFWVPQHAICGWTGAVLFALWRRGGVPIGVMLATMPLLALWSPLGVMGTVPFAILAGLGALARRTVRAGDVLLPAAAAVLALPSLAYLAADAGRVGAHLAAVPPKIYLVFEMVEVVPLLTYLAAARATRIAGAPALVLAGALLAGLPFVAIGSSVDFMMRASIPALTLIALDLGAVLGERTGSWRTPLIVLLALGALTPAREVLRALIFRPSPPPRCDVAAAWQESFAMYRDDTYFARVSTLPAAIRPIRPAPLPPYAPPGCWTRPWKVPR